MIVHAGEVCDMTMESTLPSPDQPAASRPGEQGPSPLELARKRHRPPAGGASKQLECLACERVTPHELGPATYGRDGSLLVQWWTCAECHEGRTVG
ncbi:hypothetical protein CFH99_22980 [Nocardioides aromaticivorans]|uniref:Uncharacterized protein n=2 Tax=Nocardioides aromaticivorans TaxID=200618 RepID=A0ABX7PS98_9ACTN|nr:hypothetical protein CFH99_22980 [Nocardioides aromaticivorans]